MSHTDALIVHSAPDSVPRRQRRVLGYLRRRPIAMLAVAYLALLVLVGVFATRLVPHDPYRTDFLAILKPPSSTYPLGTDEIGRDVLSRLIMGARTSLVAASIAVWLSTITGVVFGLLAGYFGGWCDAIFSRVNDAIMSVPGLLLALALVSVLGAGLTNSMIALGIVFIPRVFRVVRASTIDVRHQVFIEASLALGCSRRRILLSHVLPNTLSPLLVVISVSYGTAIIAESGLSYLGLGAPPPTATWGGMLAKAAEHSDATHLLWAPGLALLLTVTAFTILGDGLRDALGAGRESGGE